MVTLRAAPTLLLLQVLMLIVLARSTGWGMTSWLVGIAAVTVLDAAVITLMRRTRADALGPADLVTLLRVTLACGVTGLVAQALLATPAPDGPTVATITAASVITALSAVAVTLDAVDGWVARHTGTASAFGARFDGESDAYLMLVLSVWVAPSHGWWVLPIGLARYVFAAAGWGLPWLRAQLPARSWRKVVTAAASIALVSGSAPVVPAPVAVGALVLALLLVAESFGRDIWWLWRHRAHDLVEVLTARPSP